MYTLFGRILIRIVELLVLNRGVLADNLMNRRMTFIVAAQWSRPLYFANVVSSS